MTHLRIELTTTDSPRHAASLLRRLLARRCFKSVTITERKDA